MVTYFKSDIFSDEQIQTIRDLPEVSTAYEQLSTRTNVYFTIPLTQSIRDNLFTGFQLHLPEGLMTIPCRWIKGDTPSHKDTGQSAFENTYLVYLTDGEGEFHVGEDSYPIEAGAGFSFSEGIEHKVLNTNGTSRLLLGPMSESGFVVGTGFNYPGGTIVYIREVEVGTPPTKEIQYSVNQLNWFNISFSVTVTNSNTSLGYVKIYFTTDITLKTASDYFNCNSDYIQFGSETLNADGTRPTITIDDVTNYPGLVSNNAGATGYANIQVYNLKINSINGSTLAADGGWIGQASFGKGKGNNYIINCSSDGGLSTYGGGIVGINAGTESGGSLTIIGCSSTANISADYSGGIAGANGGANGGSITCDSCWSEGAISGLQAGGILGPSPGWTGGSATVTKCYSTGAISGTSSGGIIGNIARNSTVTSCYSTGTVSGTNAGGILGNNADDVTVTNCYSVGNMSVASAGGIVGNNIGSTYTITNCYTSGTVTSSKGYILGNSTTIPSNCYSEANSGGSGWSTTNANSVLTGEPTASPGVGNTWAATASNTAYELASFGPTPYLAAIISANAFVQSNSQTITAGQASSAGLLSASNSYSILDKSGGDSGSHSAITINATTGAISTTTSVVAGTYTLKVRRTGSYFITTFVLSVTGYVPPAVATTTSCCTSTIDERGLDYQQILDYKIGNRLLLEVSQNSKTKFDGYSQFVKYKMAQGSRKY